MLRFLIAGLLILQSSTQQNRPTQPTDPMPPPNLDYFIGTWSFDWNVPDSPLGSGGKLKGTETYKKIFSGQVYESDIEGESPDGPFKGRALTSYDEREKTVSRFEVLSYGFSALKSGPIGGDLGGYYTIYWESTLIKKNGHTVKFKGKTQMLSPAHYKQLVEISVDGGPFTNYGYSWFRRVDPKPTS